MSTATSQESTNTDKVWLITGCSTGLGRALAQQTLARGYRVVATSRNAETLADLASEHPDRCLALQLDVTDPANVESAIHHAARSFGRIDVVVNNAGYGLVGAFEELSEEQIARNFAVNFFGALSVTRAILPILREQKSGHIVNISAAAAIANYAGFSIYGASKWALEGVSESLAIELKPLGIKVTIVQPGPFKTDFISRSLERGEKRIADYDRSSGKFLRFLESIDGKQPGDPAKAADAIIAAVESPAPPSRLVLGKYANDKLRRKLADAEKERMEWESIGVPTGFADMR